ncbi:post-transcriptional regulator [Microaerobacter geothermalis]|uniref:post-transcriptional regulator n=1 Tax=Microaerobacter geothermalis TaxID=674972 RepID=UPI001F174EF4|nr:post-transcriptional regulator [Microaerobacter geothermalis]MCF6092759.1 post-transcriptional regulator [Microaerobacter geothermalis]
MEKREQENYDHQLTKQIEDLCESKAEEFQFLGYERITGKDIWNCVSSNYKNGYPPLHVLVNDILSLKVTAYMNWMTINAFKGVNLD